MNATEVAAWWGAVIATITFIWNIFVWLRAKPRIVVKAEWHELLDDRWIRFTITNRGKEATSIEKVTLTDQSKYVPIDQIRDECSFFPANWQKQGRDQLPAILQPGAVLQEDHQVDSESAMPGEATLESLYQAGKLFCHIKHSHADAPIVGKVTTNIL